MSAATCARSRSLARRRAERRARQLGALLVVAAGSRCAPSGSSARVCGLAMSCSSAPKRSAAAAGQLVGQRLGQQRARRARPALVAERGARDRARGRSRPGGPRACGRARRGGGSGSARRRAARRARAARRPSAPSSSMSASPRTAASAPTMRSQLGEDALRRRRRPGRGACARAAAAVVGVELEAELGRQAREAQHAQRVGVERAGADHAQPPCGRGRRAPPWGSTSSPPASGSAIALTVKSRAREVGLERAALQRREVDLPAAVAARPRARRRTASESANAGAAGAAAQAARGRGARRRRRRRRGRASGAPEQAVAQRAADEPRRARRPAPRASGSITAAPRRGGARAARAPSART